MSEPTIPNPNNFAMAPSNLSQPDSPESTQEDYATQKRRSMRNIISTVVLFLAAPFTALILIMFVIQSYEVDGPSMNYTLHDKDLLIVNKTPRTIARITNNSYIPDRYDIIIFSLNEGNSSRQLVKRVVGLPGDRVVVKNEAVTIYNSQHPNGYNPDAKQPYTKYTIPTSGSVDLTVPDGQVFVMGDNRGNSLDSRAFGPISADSIVGKLGIRIFPLGQAKKF